MVCRYCSDLSCQKDVGTSVPTCCLTRGDLLLVGDVISRFDGFSYLARRQFVCSQQHSVWMISCCLAIIIASFDSLRLVPYYKRRTWWVIGDWSLSPCGCDYTNGFRSANVQMRYSVFVCFFFLLVFSFPFIYNPWNESKNRKWERERERMREKKKNWI